MFRLAFRPAAFLLELWFRSLPPWVLDAMFGAEEPLGYRNTRGDWVE